MTELPVKRPCLHVATWLVFFWSGLAHGQEPAVVEDASAREFTVEVIVFRYAESVSAGTEVFVPDPLPEPVEPEPAEDGVLVFGDPGTVDNGAIPLDADGNPLELDADGNPIELDADGNPIVAEPILEPRADFVLMLDDELMMLTEWDRLDRLDAYEPVAHFGWHQRVRPFDDPVGIAFDDLTPPVSGFEGDFTLYLSRFLHLAVNLELDANPEADGSFAETTPVFSDERYLEPFVENDTGLMTGPTYYRINEDRIFKSGDLRYFDHPRFGVLARINRVEEPEVDEADAEVPANEALEPQ